MKQKGHFTAFYIETLVMILVFVGIILVLTQVFAAAKKKSAEAKTLTTAVCLAENLAEAFQAAETPDELYRLLDAAGTHESDGSLSGSVNSFTALYNDDMKLAPGGAYRMEMNWGTAESGQISGLVTVIHDGSALWSLPLSSAGKEGFAR